MLQLRRTQMWIKGLAVVAILFFAEAAIARIIFLRTTVYIEGVDENGTRNFENGAFGNALIVKETRTGMIAQSARAIVFNASEVGQCYINFGSEVFDPEVQETQIAVIDLLRVGPTGRSSQLSIAFNRLRAN